jgi:hypothetical protein
MTIPQAAIVRAYYFGRNNCELRPSELIGALTAYWQALHAYFAFFGLELGPIPSDPPTDTVLAEIEHARKSADPSYSLAHTAPQAIFLDAYPQGVRPIQAAVISTNLSFVSREAMCQACENKYAQVANNSRNYTITVQYYGRARTDAGTCGNLQKQKITVSPNPRVRRPPPA